MAFQLSVAVRNAMLDQIEVAIGVSAIMKIRTGSPPSDCTGADTGTVLATLNLPSDWLANASAGAKPKAGTWEDTSADASGTAGYFRVYDFGGTNCHMQGTITATGGGGDMTLDNIAISAAQDVVITGFTLTAGNA